MAYDLGHRSIVCMTREDLKEKVGSAVLPADIQFLPWVREDLDPAQHLCQLVHTNGKP